MSDSTCPTQCTPTEKLPWLLWGTILGATAGAGVALYVVAQRRKEIQVLKVDAAYVKEEAKMYGKSMYAPPTLAAWSGNKAPYRRG